MPHTPQEQYSQQQEATEEGGSSASSPSLRDNVEYSRTVEAHKPL